MVVDKQSVGEAPQYEKRRERLIATNRYDSYVKAATEHKRKSRSENERIVREGGNRTPARM